jgi:16S rRNA (guanine(527)-N(7))-methyltransferase RsmG
MEDNKNLAVQLEHGISSLGLEISTSQQECMIQYLTLLIKWNKAFNLSGIKNPQSMLKLHILDSLSIVPYIDGELILDVGTGAGLPGFVLAICFPQKKFILLDSNGKKTRFMFQTASALGVRNIEVVHKRAEDFQTKQQIDIVVSRAFTSLKQFIGWTQHLLSDHSKLLAMKGLYPHVEIAELPDEFKVIQTHLLSIPGEETERHLLELRKTVVSA